MAYRIQGKSITKIKSRRNSINVKDLEGNDYQLKLISRIHKSRSQYHRLAREILADIFLSAPILEEVTIKVLPGESLYLDFFIPLYRIAVEVHGEQHFKFNAHFYNSKLDFIRAKKNDRKKAEWCEVNGIELIELDYKEKKNWPTQLKNA